MKPKYTPGPWFADNHHNWKISVQFGPPIKISENVSKLQLVAMLPEPDFDQIYVPGTPDRSPYYERIANKDSLDKVLANADLLAAAPEMFAALKWILEVSSDKIDPASEALVAVRKAIAKAEGKES